MIPKAHSGSRIETNSESGIATPQRTMTRHHIAPMTMGHRNFSAVNSRPLRRPSYPPETSIRSAIAIFSANAGRESIPSKLPTNGMSILKESGSERSWRRPSASVTYVTSFATDAA